MIGNKIRHKISQRAGFTLIEVMVSVSLFAMIILSVTGIFKMAIDAQRSAIAAQNVQESLKYFFEITGKEMRMAIKNTETSGCGSSFVPVGDIFQVIETDENSERLRFRNYYGECVVYFLQETGSDGIKRFAIARTATGITKIDFISPEKININSLHFVINSSGSQPMVTMNLNASALNNAQFESNMTLQTSITSRYYREK